MIAKMSALKAIGEEKILRIFFIFESLEIQKQRLKSKAIQCSISITPENVRKPKVPFDVFKRYRTGIFG